MVRIGGGWDTLDHFLLKHDPCRLHAMTSKCKLHKHFSFCWYGAGPVLESDRVQFLRATLYLLSISEEVS